MPLTDTAPRNAKPTEKPRKLADARGLHLLVNPSGGKPWRFKYRVAAKEGLLAPVAREWLGRYSPTRVPTHADRIVPRVERDVFPWIGARPIAERSAPELLAVVRRVEARGALETAHRALQAWGQVFRHAVPTGRAERDPTWDLRGALAPMQKGHSSALAEPAKVGELLRAPDGCNGTLTVRCALRLAPLAFVRPGELRKAGWSDFDLDAGEWRYTRSKTGTPHSVPLATQAVAILRARSAPCAPRRITASGPAS